MIVTSDHIVLMLDLNKWTASQARGVASKLAQALHDNTPRDTGYARSNWVVTLGSPTTVLVGSKTSVDNSRFESSLALLQAWQPETLPAAYISNNVPYIGKLNDGWSGQAPSGFIEAAIEQAQASAEWPIQG